ncbi:hypothetical protein [Paenibacillus thermotolerans]|uniref:hypothetical protein n=1 Tax=Paenibacillus thermotolerans TaxID=3027807 RepID=UPI00236794A5|nr:MULTISPECIES: hypothetical protein [unclassified Paenibacillus]
MENVVYEKSFNLNEWVVIAMIVIGSLIVIFLPKRYTWDETAFNVLIGVFFGLLFDHTIGIPPFDYYDLGDEAKYQLFDVFSYAMYAPFGYLFIYVLEAFKLRGFAIVLYIAVWAGLGVMVEWVGTIVGIFHYKHGYKLLYSAPIYLIVESIHLGTFYMLFRTYYTRRIVNR